MNTKTTTALGTALICLFTSCANNTQGTVNASAGATGGYPYAISIPNQKGYVRSPYNNRIVDVRGIPSNGLCADPSYPASDKKYFRVPGSSYANAEASQFAHNHSTPKEKSGFAKFLGGALEGAVGLAGVAAETVVQNPQLLAGNSRSSSYNANTAAMQQLTNQASAGNTQSSQSQQESATLGPMSLGAASGPISVVFNASRYTSGNGAIHSVYAQKKKNWTNAQGYVSGYNAQGVLHTSNFEVLFASQGPHTKPVVLSGANDFSRGLKEVKITKYW